MFSGRDGDGGADGGDLGVYRRGRASAVASGVQFSGR